jgi:hypothetical protein
MTDEDEYFDFDAKGKSMRPHRRARRSRNRVGQTGDTRRTGIFGDSSGNGAPSQVKNSAARSAAPKTVDGPMFRIEKGIPVPSSYGRRFCPEAYSFAYMEVGDSVLIPWVAEEAHPDTAAKWRQLLRNYTEMKFTTRSLDEGLRVWRIE